MGRPKIEYDQKFLKQNALKRGQKILLLDLINVFDKHRNNGEQDPYFS